MRNKKLTVALSLILALAALSACDLTADDATRIKRAEQNVAGEEYRTAIIELKNVLRSDPANVEARILLGKASLESGDASTAAKELERARELGADPGEYLVPLARAMLMLGQPDVVIKYRTEELETPGDRADLNALHGKAYFQKGAVEKAEEAFSSALTDVAGHADAMVGLARVHLNRSESDPAEQLLGQVLAKHDDSHSAYATLGQSKMNNELYASAEENFRLAISHSEKPALRRERLSYMSSLIDALLAQKKPGQAQVVSAQMLALVPDHPLAIFQGAQADFEAGEMDNALSKAQRVVTALPDYLPARLLMAAAAMSKKNFALAELHLRAAVNIDPGNEQARELLARTKMNMGSPAEALKVLEPLLADGSANARLLAMAGSASLRSGNTEKGVEYLSRGAQAGSTDPAAQIQAVSSFILAGQFNEAIATLEQMPESAHGEQRDFLLILARLRAGDTEMAREKATQLLEQRQDDPAAHKIMGSFHMAVKEYDLARAQFEKVIELDPLDAISVINLARLEVLTGDTDAAGKRYNDLLARDPGNLTGLLGLAELAQKAGNQERAVELLEQARVANPDAVQPPLFLARHYLKTGRTDLAAERAGQTINTAPHNVDALIILGRTQLLSNRYSEALGTFEKALRQEPDRVETHFFLGQAQQKLGMTAEWRATLDRTLELSPKHFGTRVVLSRLESEKENFIGALELANGLKVDYPDSADPHLLEGDIHILRGHFSDAINAYDRAGAILPNEFVTLKRFKARQLSGRADSHKVLEEWLEREPGSVKIRVALGQAYQSNGLINEAVSEYKLALKSDPDNIVALNNLAWSYAELGGADNLKQGLEIARQTHEKLPTVGQITDTYGWLLLEQGNVKQATRKLREATDQAPDDRDIRYHLAVALQRSGDVAEARTLLDGILSESSTFENRNKAQALRDKL